MSDEDRDLLNSILRHIPGFRGYADQEDRRESDQKTRSVMADTLQGSKQSLDEYSRALADAAKIDDLPHCDKLRKSIDQVVARFRSSVQGYSGLFDAQRIDEDKLEDVYDCDAWLLDQVDELAREVQQLKSSRAAPADVLPQLIVKLDSINSRLDQRETLLKELGSS